MCDRYTLTCSVEELQNFFGVKMDNFHPFYNAGPTQKLPIIKAKSNPEVNEMFWGLIFNWSNNKKISPKLFNLPKQSALEKKAYQKGLVENRCLIMADGFFLWKQIGKKQNTPYHFYLTNHSPFGIAALWEDYEDMDGKNTQSFIMLTTESSKEVAPYQEDMPLLLDRESMKKWLQTDLEMTDINEILNQKPSGSLKFHAVSPMINNLENNSPELIKTAVPSDQHGNYTLFS